MLRMLKFQILTLKLIIILKGPSHLPLEADEGPHTWRLLLQKKLRIKEGSCIKIQTHRKGPGYIHLQEILIEIEASLLLLERKIS